MFAGISIPCKIHFQRADKSGLHGLYVPPSSLWSPSRSWRSGKQTRRPLAWARRSSWKTNGTTLGIASEQDGFAFGDSEMHQQPRRAGKQFRDSARQPSLSELQSMIVDNSVICVVQGSSIVWELKDGVYPIYIKVSAASSRQDKASV